MIKSRRQARLTNKTRLAVHRGDLEGAEPVLLDDESGSGKSNLNSDGVEKGEDQGEQPLSISRGATAVDGPVGELGRVEHAAGEQKVFEEGAQGPLSRGLLAHLSLARSSRRSSWELSTM
jgi:hypothetical protein